MQPHTNASPGGRSKQSMAEHEAILKALNEGDSQYAEEALRGYVAVQVENFQDLVASIRKVSE